MTTITYYPEDKRRWMEALILANRIQSRASLDVLNVTIDMKDRLHIYIGNENSAIQFEEMVEEASEWLRV